jgi:hypothetical protein
MTSTELVDPRASVRAYLEAEKAAGTLRAYKSDWHDFCAWCDTVNLNTLCAAGDLPGYVDAVLRELPR